MQHHQLSSLVHLHGSLQQTIQELLQKNANQIEENARIEKDIYQVCRYVFFSSFSQT